jgi:hypothetical protein
VLTFFGLTQEYRIHLFSEIHEIVFHGNGGYNWNTIYNMPIWLRKFTFNKIKEYYDKQQEENEKHQNQLTNKSNSKSEIARPNIPPPKESTYSYKVPKK